MFVGACVRVADRVAGGGWRVAKSRHTGIGWRRDELAWHLKQFVIRKIPLDEPMGWFWVEPSVESACLGKKQTSIAIAIIKFTHTSYI